MIRNILLVGLGGSVGSVLRYFTQRWFSLNFPSHFPWGTLTVNIVGCFAIGLFWGMTFRSYIDNEHWKLLLMTGLCGGFTTFSAFTLEGVGLLREQRIGYFFSYVIASVVIGLVATYAGMKLIR